MDVTWLAGKLADYVVHRTFARCEVCHHNRSWGNTTFGCCRRPICSACWEKAINRSSMSFTANFHCPLCKTDSDIDESPPDLRDGGLM